MKGIAVSQIVLLVLGILVLSVVAYLLYTNFIASGSGFDAEKCRAGELRICTIASAAGGGSKTVTPEYDESTAGFCAKSTTDKITCKNVLPS